MAKKRTQAVIPVETVEKMWSLYVKDEPKTAIARECGVTVDTVRRYEIKGDPNRKIRPFKARRNELITRVQQLSDEDSAKRLTEHVEATRQLMARTLRNTFGALDDADPDTKMVPSVAEATMALRANHDAIRLVTQQGQGPGGPLIQIDARQQTINTGEPQVGAPPPLAALRALAGMTTEEGNALTSAVQKFIRAEEEAAEQDALPSHATRST